MAGYGLLQPGGKVCERSTYRTQRHGPRSVRHNKAITIANWLNHHIAQGRTQYYIVERTEAISRLFEPINDVVNLLDELTQRFRRALIVG
jgi:hypothetical protein